MRFIISLLLTGVVIALASYLAPGVTVAGFGWAILAGLIIGFVNATVGALLRLLTAPLNFITLGLISFVITVLMVMLTGSLMGTKFEVAGFWSAAFFAIIVAILEMIVGSFWKSKD